MNSTERSVIQEQSLYPKSPDDLMRLMRKHHDQYIRAWIELQGAFNKLN